MAKIVSATGELQKGTLSKKWVFLYISGCLVTTGICVSISIAWWFKGQFLDHLSACVLCFCSAGLLQSTTLLVTSKRISREHKSISSGKFLRTLFRLLGSKVSVGASMFLVGLSLLVLAMMIWKTYSQFLGVWIGVTSVGYMVVMPILHWTDPRYTPGTKHARYR